MMMRIGDIRLWVLDVDGTMTDSGIYYDGDGKELKKFCTRDAVGIAVLRYIGVRTMVLTGRECDATERRMKELGIDYIYQGIPDKKAFMEGFMGQNGLSYKDIAYTGDDLNDLALMRECRYKACPADAAPEIREISDDVSACKGGAGVVTDVVRTLLAREGVWSQIIREIYH